MSTPVALGVQRRGPSSVRSRQAARASLPPHQQTRWQTRRNNVNPRRTMADENKGSPRKHGSRVHRYGPQSARRRVGEQLQQARRTEENNDSAASVSATVLDNNGRTADRRGDVSGGERLDGDGSSFSDKEQEEQEAEELAKLRCPSERTEVIAEREARRRKRRCADYPGLAFGSSIFSSDTLMKFSIIKNELHNILNSQLKRVSGEGTPFPVVNTS